jgi:peroxiredoxin
MVNNQNTSAQPGSHQLVESMAVFDADGERVGTLKSAHTHSGYLLVHRGRLVGHDGSLPQDLIARIDASGVHLSFRKDLLETYVRTSPPPTAPQAGASGMDTAPGPGSLAPPDEPTPGELHRTAPILPPHRAVDVPAAPHEEALASVPGGTGHAADQFGQRAELPVDLVQRTAQDHPRAVQLTVGDQFPDGELPDQTNSPVRLSHLTRPSLLDERLGFGDGYPLIVQFFRGFFCPRDQQQMRQYVQFQQELAVNYAKLVAISAHPPLVNAAFRAGLGATWPFLSDEPRALIRQLGLLDETEGEYASRAQPYTFVLWPDLRSHALYAGW